MTFDPTKLTPAAKGSIPWRYSRMSPEDWGFYELARHALDIMMRRGWHAIRHGEAWIVVIPGVEMIDQGGGFEASDPFSVLVAAEKWYVENIEA